MWRTLRGAVGLAVVLATAGCGRHSEAGAVRRQHAALYGCAEGGVDVRHLGRRTLAAAGCGRRAIYVCRRGAVCEQTSASDPPSSARASAPPPPPARREASPRPPPPPTLSPQALEARANPRAPELGGTRGEAELLCRGQGGVFDVRTAPGGSLAVGCQTAGALIFAGHLDPATERFDELDVWLEGANVRSHRIALEGRWGPASETVGAEGVRAWRWSTSEGTLTLRLYSRGVRISSSSPRAATPAQ